MEDQYFSDLELDTITGAVDEYLKQGTLATDTYIGLSDLGLDPDYVVSLLT